MVIHRNVWAAVAGMALVGAGLAGPAAPAAAAPAPGPDRDAPAAAGPLRAADPWEEPTPGTSAEIEFTDAVTSARAASLSPYLAEIVREAERVRTVEIGAQALERPLAAESVAIELFDDVSIDLETNVALSEGAQSSSTYAAGGRDGAAVLTVIGEDVHGVLWQGTTKYGIEPLSNGRHLVFEDGRTFPEEAPPVGSGEEGAGPAEGGVGTLATTVVDVMVAYDDTTVAQFGSVAATEAEILEMINVTNMVYANSQIDLELALTNILDLEYMPNATDGTTDYGTYLGAIANKTDGIVDTLHTARDDNNADLVATVSDITGACGVAYYPTGSNPAEDRAYSLTAGGCAVSNLSFPHELGHNLCASHDPPVDSTNGCGYSDGFGHFGINEGYRTVMAYPGSYNGCTGCVRIPHFSNPDVAYDGWTTGILGERDNSRVLEVKAPDIAANRGSGPAPAPCEVDYTITNTWAGNVQVDLVVENTTSSWINGWTAEWTFTGDESVYNSWGVAISQTGPDATGTGDGFGVQIPPGDSVTVGFQATVAGTPTVPSSISCAI